MEPEGIFYPWVQGCHYQVHMKIFSVTPSEFPEYEIV